LLQSGDVQATFGVPNLIADMNNANIEFTVHDGDLKAGNGTPGSTTPTTCSNALYRQGLDYVDSLQASTSLGRHPLKQESRPRRNVSASTGRRSASRTAVGRWST
jgi:hypothetical protein